MQGESRLRRGETPSDQSELREIQTGRAAPYNVGMMGFLHIEKRTCRMGQ